jgi:two-component system sensor histidine kinase/response regulator
MEQAKEALYTALQQNDLAAMGRQAHVIKGAAANLGALTLYRHAQRLERDLAHTPTRNDSLNKVIHVIHSDLHNLQQTIELLTRNLPETTVKAPSILSADELATSLQRLTEQIDEHLLVSAEQLAQLSASLGEPALKISMEKIESALNQFDFDCAAAALATLKQQLKQQLNASHSNQDFQTTCSLGA